VFCLSVAGITAGVSCEEPLSLRVGGSAKSFLVDCPLPDITLRVATGDLSQPFGGDRIFDSGVLWQLYKDGDSLLFRFTSPTCGPVPYKAARFTSDFTAGEVCLHRPYFDRDAPLYPLEYPLDELILTNYLARGRGVEIHACGVIDRSGAGYLFAGHSGAGKTTVARLWTDEPGVIILSDDRVVLRPVDGRIQMYGTPWHGDAQLAAPAAVPLNRIFFLQHGRSHQIAPVKGALAAARLFSCAFVPFYSGAALDFTLELLNIITTAVPCHAFSFTPDKGAIDFVRRLLP
jgi:hypothetical protein